MREIAELPGGLPPTIRIGHRDLHLVALTKLDADDRKIYGEHSSNGAEIRVWFAHPTRGAILLHEILHAIHYEYSLEDGDGEERVVTAFGHGLKAAIRDNPEVFAWIAAND